MTLLCHHQWSWPRKSKVREPEEFTRGFDSYQVCTKCGDERLYNFETLQPGPVISGEGFLREK